ncbi:Protein LURP-one-related 15 [Morella rubra]|uniref:Protein LURP-one-related 15 n=1 Tax=Morella rubra TaxID=262757 RepID=A0A6A1WJ93_9ROSI|nr:Protein LURP-one-related 15 [Morella rubra]
MAGPCAASAQVALPRSVGSPSSNGSVVLEIYRTKDGYIVAQECHEIVFKVRKTSNWTDAESFLLTDADNNPIFTLRKKIVTAHARWKVFKGDSIDPKHLLFRSAKSSIIQRATELNVFFANKEAEVDSLDPKQVDYDFKIKETSSRNSFAIYSGDSSTIVGKVEKRKSDERGNLKVIIHPNLDSAFATAVIVILDQLKGIPFKLPFWPIVAAGNAVVAAVTES